MHSVPGGTTPVEPSGHCQVEVVRQVITGAVRMDTGEGMRKWEEGGSREGKGEREETNCWCRHMVGRR
jgi:hypothetical protein